jgi:hypothetical protein
VHNTANFAHDAGTVPLGRIAAASAWHPAGVTFIFGVAQPPPATSGPSPQQPDDPLNGKTWKTVTIPKLPGQGLGILYGVAATSTSNAWAVGYYNDTTGVSHIVILRWAGTAWTRVG